MPDRKLSLGPGALAESGTSGGPGFILSATEFVALQVYVTDALALPKTEAEFRAYIGKGAPQSLTEFNPLIDTYKSMHTSCTTWREETFPATVKLASQIYEYGANTVPVYYPPILPLADQLVKHPEDQRTKDKLLAILGVLKQEAVDMESSARATQKEVGKFADASQDQYDKLVGKDGLFGKYEKSYGDKSADVAKWTKEIADQRRILQEANDEYDKAVVIAATTPSYAWCGLPGLIAASVVAGIYGTRATDALKKARAAEGKINSLTDSLTTAGNVMNALHLSNFSISNITRTLNGALPVIQKIQGVWGAMADDIDKIAIVINNNIRNLRPVIMDLFVEQAILSWSNVANNADNYRKNAYVRTPPVVSMEAWRLNRMLELELPQIEPVFAVA